MINSLIIFPIPAYMPATGKKGTSADTLTLDQLRGGSWCDLSMPVNPDTDMSCSNPTTSEFYLSAGSSFAVSNSQAENIDQKAQQYTANFKMLRQSFLKHEGRLLAPEYTRRFEDTASSLSALTFREALVQYNKFDCAIDFSFILPDKMELSVTKFIEDDIEDLVDVSLYHHKEMILTGEMPVNVLIEKMSQITA
jgi:hypothetical protein